MSSNKYTSDEKIHMMEQLIPQLEALLPIVRDHAACLLNNGTVESGKPQISLPDKKSFCDSKCLYLDKPGASYQSIQIGIHWLLDAFEVWRNIPTIRWNKDGVVYSVGWLMNPNGRRWKTIPQKFWFLRWKKKVMQYFPEIQFLDFASLHDGEMLNFALDDGDRQRMSIDLHTKLCGTLSAIYNQYEMASNHALLESQRLKNEEKSKKLRHFENLLNPPGHSK
ncbi:MAG: hypothetical protein MJ058_05525 [Akkermansia sp.]|nr:hypothetical protein [Akkermansia sp.]